MCSPMLHVFRRRHFDVLMMIWDFSRSKINFEVELEVAESRESRRMD